MVFISPCGFFPRWNYVVSTLRVPVKGRLGSIVIGNKSWNYWGEQKDWGCIWMQFGEFVSFKTCMATELSSAKPFSNFSMWLLGWIRPCIKLYQQWCCVLCWVIMSLDSDRDWTPWCAHLKNYSLQDKWSFQSKGLLNLICLCVCLGCMHKEWGVMSTLQMAVALEEKITSSYL